MIIFIILSCKSQSVELYILRDISLSNPLIANDVFAKVAAQKIGERVNKLKNGDYVISKTFGSRGLQHFSSKKERITKQNQAKRVAHAIAALIRKSPELDGEGSTNLLSTLENSEWNCSQVSEIWFLTDGIEASTEVNPTDLINGKIILPDPYEPDFLKGCKVIFLGLSQTVGGSLTMKQTRNLRTAWKNWMKKAGADFKAIINP